MTFASSLRIASLLASLVAVGCGGSVAGSETPDGGTTDGSTTDSGGGSDTMIPIDGGATLRCGGKAGLVCPSSMWCSYTFGTCNNPDELGTCRKREALPCPAPAPGSAVCGCNGRTYGSVCEAASSSVSVLHEGPCEAPPPPPLDNCGGSTGKVCGPGSYCDFGTGSCPSPGSIGLCVDRPTACPEPWAPVCGCDGKTYGNDCDARSNAVTIAHTGECETPPPAKTCGGFTGEVCDATEYCDWGAIPNFCGGDDGMGICKKRPITCVPADGIFCACDGKTYESPCAANAAGWGVRKNGPC
jgi:hypothetical protein